MMDASVDFELLFPELFRRKLNFKTIARKTPEVYGKVLK